MESTNTNTQNMAHLKDISMSPDKYFYTHDGITLKSLNDLEFYLKICTQSNFSYHANNEKNDFANWVSDVFEIQNLAKILRPLKNISDSRKAIIDFMNNPSNNPSNINMWPSTSIINMTQAEEKKVETNVETEKKTGEKLENNSNSNIPITKDITSQQTSKSSIIASAIADKFDSSSITSNNGFRQFSDEELEKFSKFVTKDKETNIDETVPFLQGKLQELKSMISDIRKAQKNPIIPDLMLRSINSKIDFYALTKNLEDYKKIMSELDEAKRDIEYCSNEKIIDVASEIRSQLENHE